MSEASTFNGYRKLHNVLIPISLGPAKGLNWLDKFIYGRLRFEAGNSDRCQVVFKDLARELLVSRDSVSRSIDRLEKVRLIDRRQLQYASLIVFLWSPLLNGSLPKSSRSGSAELPTLKEAEQGDSGSATLRTLEPVSDAAELRTLETSGSAELQHQGPQICGAGSAELPTVYKESLGFNLRIKKDKASERSLPATEELARPLVPFDSKAKNPEDKTAASLLAEFVALITTALTERGVKIQKADEVPQMIALASEKGITARQLVRFIEAKCEKKKPETARFFLRCIPEDIEAWSRRHKDLFEDYNPQREMGPTVGCGRCSDVGIVGHRGRNFEWDEYTRETVFCDCKAGVDCAQRSQPVYTVLPPGKQCSTCLSTLRWQSRRDELEEKKPSCAFCYQHFGSVRHWYGHPELEDPTIVAERLGALPKAEQCDQCFDPLRQFTGILKENWETSSATARYCDCRWGQRLKNSPSWEKHDPEKLAADQREWIEYRAKNPGMPRVKQRA